MKITRFVFRFFFFYLSIGRPRLHVNPIFVRYTAFAHNIICPIRRSVWQLLLLLLLFWSLRRPRTTRRVNASTLRNVAYDAADDVINVLMFSHLIIIAVVTTVVWRGSCCLTGKNIFWWIYYDYKQQILQSFEKVNWPSAVPGKVPGGPTGCYGIAIVFTVIRFFSPF